MDGNGENDGRDRRQLRRTAMEEGESLIFPMSRESETASRLKALISEKLPIFFDDYSDDVLAEYITVLVCNGRSQFQAREDLEAFLGKRSGEFVTWLWELLQKEFSQDKRGNSASDPKIVAGFHSRGTVICKSSKSGSEDYECNNSDPIHAMNAKVEKTSVPSITGRTSASIENVESHELLEENIMNVLRQERTKDVLGSAKATEKADRNSTAYNYSRKISSIVVPAFQQQGGIGSDKSKKTVPENRGIIQHQHLPLPNAELDLRGPQSAPSGRIVPAGSYDATARQKRKPRASVWDRLGKPSYDLSIGIENPRMPEISVPTLKKEVLHRHEPTFSAPNSEHIRRIQREVPVAGYGRQSSKSHTTEQLEARIITDSGPHKADNLARKRRFGNISPNAEDVSVGKGGSNLQLKEPSQDVKKPNLLPNQSVTFDLASELLNVKQQLEQIEMEMSKLQPKQLKKQNVGEPEIPSQSGELHHQQDGVESRTIYVTNVHYAATKRAISMFFAKCGAVEDVTILTEPETWNLIGAALVTFASKESVDKAIALSGTTFYSRTVKVVRRTEIDDGAATATATATSAQTNRSDFSAKHNYRIPHLTWRRDTTTSFLSPLRAPALAPATATAQPGTQRQAPAGTQRQAAGPTTVPKELSDSTKEPKT